MGTQFWSFITYFPKDFQLLNGISLLFLIVLFLGWQEMGHEVGTKWLEIVVAAKLRDCWSLKRVEDYFGETTMVGLVLYVFCLVTGLHVCIYRCARVQCLEACISMCIANTLVFGVLYALGDQVQLDPVGGQKPVYACSQFEVKLAFDVQMFNPQSIGSIDPQSSYALIAIALYE